MDANERTADFRLSAETGYFTCRGVDVIAFEDIYPAGHQGGVSLLMHGERVAANGDVRFEPTPGQWQPVPVQTGRTADPDRQRIETRLRYPDPDNHLKGFNPMVYPDCDLDYTVSVQAEGADLRITVDTDRPLPPAWAGRLCFCGLIGPDDGLNTGLSPQVLLVFPQIVSGFQVTAQHQVCLPEQAVER